jgi:hypothetical protein
VETPEPEVLTREAIERNPWNAVELDIPANADQELVFAVASAARDMTGLLGERAYEAQGAGEYALWSGLAERAAERQQEAETLILASNEPVTEQGIAYDPWVAVYRPIPRAANAELLQSAHDAAMQCAGAVAGPPGQGKPVYEPELLGANESREANFETAVRRVDELGSRLRAVEAGPVQDQSQGLAPDAAERYFSGMASAAVNTAESYIGGIFDMMADAISPSPPLSPDQAAGERAELAAAARQTRKTEEDDELRQAAAERSGDTSAPAEYIDREETYHRSAGRSRSR